MIAHVCFAIADESLEYAGDEASSLVMEFAANMMTVNPAVPSQWNLHRTDHTQADYVPTATREQPVHSRTSTARHPATDQIGESFDTLLA